MSTSRQVNLRYLLAQANILHDNKLNCGRILQIVICPRANRVNDPHTQTKTLLAQSKSARGNAKSSSPIIIAGVGGRKLW